LDGSADVVAREFPYVCLIANDTNLGFARGNNQGIQKSKGRYILLLNPDIIVHPQAIQEMLQFLEQRPRAGAVGAKLLNPDGTTQRVGLFRRFPSIRQVLFFDTILRRWAMRITNLRNRYWEYFDEDKPCEIDQVPGACLMTRRDVIQEVGLLDKDFTIWYEDVDWCYRMRKGGWELYCLPEATMTHVLGQSTIHWSTVEKEIRLHESMLKFFVKHRGPAVARLVKWIVIADRAFRMVLDLFIGRVFDLLTGRKDRRVRMEQRWAFLQWLMGYQPDQPAMD